MQQLRSLPIKNDRKNLRSTPSRSHIELRISPYIKPTDNDFERWADKIHWANDSKAVIGLLQTVLGCGETQSLFRPVRGSNISLRSVSTKDARCRCTLWFAVRHSSVDPTDHMCSVSRYIKLRISNYSAWVFDGECVVCDVHCCLLIDFFTGVNGAATVMLFAAVTTQQP